MIIASVIQFLLFTRKVLKPVFVLALSSGLGGGASVQAQTNEYSSVQHFQFYVTSHNYLFHIGKLTVDAEMALATGCRKPIAEERVDLQIQIVPEFDPQAGHPKLGQWQDQISVNRCGLHTQQNFLVAARNGGLPSFLVLLPGTTRAPAALQRQSLPVAIDSLKSVCATTDAYQIHNTEFVSQDRPISVNDDAQIIEGQWREIWKFYACDQIFNVTMVFKALGDGNIQAKSSL